MKNGSKELRTAADHDLEPSEQGGGIVLGQTEGDMQSLERNTAASIMTRHHVDTRYIRTESIKFAPAIVNTATHHNTHCTMLLPGDRPLLYLPPTGEL